MNYQDLLNKMLSEVLSKSAWMSEKEIINRLVGECNGLFDDTNKLELLARRVLRNESKPNGIISKGARKCKFGAAGYKIKTISESAIGRRRSSKPGTDTDNNHYTSKGAEYAVVAELMYSGYNANSMAVDEGIDIVASKDNIFYYIQVKSTYFDQNSKKFNYSIPVENFERVRVNNVTYIIVVRGEFVGQFTFFTFSQKSILDNISNGYINKTESNININVQYDPIDKLPYLVNGGKRTVARSYENNFEL